MAARPATRSAAQPPTQRRAPVRDFSVAADFKIEWDVRPGYDFLFSLSYDTAKTDDMPAADRAWRRDAFAALPKDIRAQIGPLSAEDVYVNVASFLVDRPEVRSSTDVVRTISSVTTRELMRAILADLLRHTERADVVRRAIDGDPAAIEELTATFPEHKRGFQALLADPKAFHQRLVAILEAWAERFAEIEDRVAAMIERDHVGRAGDRETLSGSDLIEKTTSGIRWLPEPGVRRVILAPSYFSRPYNFLLAGEDWRFFAYPIADEALDDVDPLLPPPAVVRLHRALGDPTRMRMLKLLSSRDLYLTEIAQQLDLSKPTIKHHLAQLRAAGLVTIIESGNIIYYTLRRGRLDEASTELKRFLTTD